MVEVGAQRLPTPRSAFGRGSARGRCLIGPSPALNAHARRVKDAGALRAIRSWRHDGYTAYPPVEEAMALSVGDRIPDVTLMTMTGDGPAPVHSKEALGNGT